VSGRSVAAAVLSAYRAALAAAPLTQPPGREWMFRLADALALALDAADDLAERPGGEDTRRLREIRDLLAHFDWEYHDRQLALEEIERIVTGGAR
jgi:hypothetical protein